MNYNKFEFANPYRLRLDDFVNESVIRKIAHSVGSACVLVRDKYIQSVSSTPVEAADATVIDASGKTLMPGLIDAHAHITGLTLSPKNISYPEAEIVLACSEYLRNSLMDGFTTIREAG